MIGFTIVTCTYNATNVLQRTLDSVMGQAYPHVEHIIIDGVSGDETLAMAERYKRKSNASGTGHSVILLSQRDNGLYDAMNKGIKMATADYILFLNAGDVFPSRDTLSVVASTIKGGEALPGVLYGDTDIVNINGKFLRHRRLSPPLNLSWRSFKRGMLVCHQAFYANANISKRTPYDLSFKFSADVDWCVRVMKEAEREGLAIRRVPAVVVDYLDGGMTTTNHMASLRERFHVMKSHYGLIPTIFSHLWFTMRAVIKR